MSPMSSRRICRLPAVLSLLLVLSLTLGGCAATGSVSATDESQGADLARALPTALTTGGSFVGPWGPESLAISPSRVERAGSGSAAAAMVSSVLATSDTVIGRISAPISST